MPAAVVKAFAKKTGKSEEEVEKLWDKAKGIAIDDGRKEDDENFYPYVTGILKKMLKLTDESMASITTTSVGNAATLGGSANFADKMGANRKKEKKKEKAYQKFLKQYT